MTPPRVVLDANVWVSGVVFPSGVPGELIDMVIHGEVVSFHSVPIMREVLRNVRKVGRSDDDLTNAWLVLREFSIPVEPVQNVDLIAGKDSDNRILECAVAANADMIVSGDKRH